MTLPPAISTSEFAPITSASAGLLVCAGVLAVLLAGVLRQMGLPEMIGLMVGGAMSGPLLGVSLSDVVLVHELLYFTALGSLVLLVGRWREAWRVRRLSVSGFWLLGGGALAVTGTGFLGLLAGWWMGEVRTGVYAGLLAGAFVLPGGIWFEWAGHPMNGRAESAGRLWALAGVGVVLLALPWVNAPTGAYGDLIRVYAIGLYIGALALVLGAAWVPGLYARSRRTSGSLGKVAVVVPLVAVPVMLAAGMEMPMTVGAVWAGLLASGCVAVSGDPTRNSERLLTAGMLLLLGMSVDVGALLSGEVTFLVVSVAIGLFAIRNIAGTVLDSVARWATESAGSEGRLRRAHVLPLAGLPLLVVYEGDPALFAPIAGEHLVISATLGVFGCLVGLLGVVSTWRAARHGQTRPDRSKRCLQSRSRSKDLPPADRSTSTVSGAEDVLVAGSEAGPRTIRLAAVTEQSAAAGRAVGDLDLYRRFGVVPIGLWRGDLYLTTGGEEAPALKRGDLLVLAGPADRLEATAGYLAGTDSASRTARDSTH